MMRRATKLAFGVLSIALAVVLLAFFLPHALGIGWRDTVHQMAAIPFWDVMCLVGVWAAGLCLHAVVLRRSLPGLSRRRAFALNLGGSSVSNVLPFGGAAGIGLNYAMLRSWGYDRVQITAFATVSNLVVALVKVLIAIGGVVALAFMPTIAGQLDRPTSPAAVALYVCVGLGLAAGVGGGLGSGPWPGSGPTLRLDRAVLGKDGAFATSRLARSCCRRPWLSAAAGGVDVVVPDRFAGPCALRRGAGGLRR